MTLFTPPAQKSTRVLVPTEMSLATQVAFINRVLKNTHQSTYHLRHIANVILYTIYYKSPPLFIVKHPVVVYNRG